MLECVCAGVAVLEQGLVFACNRLLLARVAELSPSSLLALCAALAKTGHPVSGPQLSSLCKAFPSLPPSLSLSRPHQRSLR